MQALLLSMTGIAVLCGVAVANPPDTTIVAALFSLGAAILVLADIGRARFNARYPTQEQCTIAQASAIKRARTALSVAELSAAIGTGVLLFAWTFRFGYVVGWMVVLASVVAALASRGFFDVADALERRRVEIAHENAQGQRHWRKNE